MEAKKKRSKASKVHPDRPASVVPDFERRFQQLMERYAKLRALLLHMADESQVVAQLATVCINASVAGVDMRFASKDKRMDLRRIYMFCQHHARVIREASVALMQGQGQLEEAATKLLKTTPKKKGEKK